MVSNAFFRMMILVLALMIPAAFASGEDEPAEDYPGPSNYLRTAIQAGKIIPTNSFLEGDNATGQPIDSFQSLRLDLGWQTDGSRDWHHSYNFPSYGFGIYGANMESDELGTPSSLYGFFVWPLARGERWIFNFDINFGFTNDWEPYDPETNANQTSMGLGRSVHIEGGPNVEYRLANRWALIGGFTFTHFSNGGTQRPNDGLNQYGPLLYVKYDTDGPVPVPARRHISEYDKGWDLTVTGSGGKRNLDLELTTEETQQYANKNYFIGNLTVGMGKRFSYKSRYVFGLDLGYDESVYDLMTINDLETGQNSTKSGWDKLELAVFGGYEIVAHRTHLIIHFGYKIFYKDIPNRLPPLYQRLGVKQFFYQNWFAGMNVRFHELGSADNLEWTIGYKVKM